MRAYDESHVLPNSRLRQKMKTLVPQIVLILLIPPIMSKVYTGFTDFLPSFKTRTYYSMIFRNRFGWANLGFSNSILGEITEIGLVQEFDKLENRYRTLNEETAEVNSRNQWSADWFRTDFVREAPKNWRDSKSVKLLFSTKDNFWTFVKSFKPNEKIGNRNKSGKLPILS